jgi:hypothetical protein
MTREKISGVALIAGALATLVVMGFHPTAHDLLGEAGRSAARVNLLVHAMAIASCPVLFFGALGVNRRFPSDQGWATGAIVFWGFALVGVTSAALASGLIAPQLISWITSGDEANRPLYHALLAYNGQVNQAFAKVHVAMSSVAILLWSIAIITTRAFARPIGWLGCVVGVGVLVGLFSGYITLDVHGFGVVILLQAAWLFSVGARMIWSRTETLEQRTAR